MEIEDIPPWRNQDEEDNDSEKSEKPHSHDDPFDRPAAGFSRRQFMRTAGVAGATGLALGAGFSVPVLADDDDDRNHRDDDRDGDADDKAAPLPIPGGTVLPFSTETYHFFPPPAPGNPGGAEPSSITDFRGFIGLSIVKGAGTGTNTATGATSRFFFDTDNRFMIGRYLDMCDHREHIGAFAFL